MWKMWAFESSGWWSWQCSQRQVQSAIRILETLFCGEYISKKYWLLVKVAMLLCGLELLSI